MIDTPAVATLVRRRAKQARKARVLSVGALTHGLAGEQLSEMAALKAVGCVALGNAMKPLANTLVERRALEYAATFGITVFLRPEDTHLRDSGCVHEGAVSARLGLPGIPEAAETVVTADVAVHQLHLTEQDVCDFDANCHVIPPLRTLSDREALRAGVRDGTLAAICSDHQPHEFDAKVAPFPATAPGISGLETLLPLTLRLVEEGVLDLPAAIERLTWGPARILGLPYGRLEPGRVADVCVFDPQSVWTLDPAKMASSGRNTPFAGWELAGRVTHTLFEGRLVFRAAP